MSIAAPFYPISPPCENIQWRVIPRCLTDTFANFDHVYLTQILEVKLFFTIIDCDLYVSNRIYKEAILNPFL